MSRDHWTAEEYKEYQRTGRMPGECVGATHSKEEKRREQREAGRKYWEMQLGRKLPTQEETEKAWAAAVARGEIMVLDIPCGPEDLRKKAEQDLAEWYKDHPDEIDILDPEKLEKAMKATKRKYRNEPTVVDGIRFDSRHEAQVWEELKMRQRAGELRGVLRQVRFDLIPGELEYRADFVTIGNDMRVEVLDAKSEITRKDKVYVIKKKLMRERWGIEIKEV